MVISIDRATLSADTIPQIIFSYGGAAWIGQDHVVAFRPTGTGSVHLEVRAAPEFEVVADNYPRTREEAASWLLSVI